MCECGNIHPLTERGAKMETLITVCIIIAALLLLYFLTVRDRERRGASGGNFGFSGGGNFGSSAGGDGGFSGGDCGGDGGGSC